MLKYVKTDISEGIDVDKTDESRECKFCHKKKNKIKEYQKKRYQELI